MYAVEAAGDGVDTDRTKIVGLALSNAFIAFSGALVALVALRAAGSGTGSSAA